MIGTKEVKILPILPEVCKNPGKMCGMLIYVKMVYVLVYAKNKFALELVLLIYWPAVFVRTVNYFSSIKIQRFFWIKTFVGSNPDH